MPESRLISVRRDPIASLLRVALLLLACGFGGCAPSELFSSIDRNCYVADWTNHHSCVSCCCCKHGSCRRPVTPKYPMLVLGRQTNDAQNTIVEPIGDALE